MATLMYKEGNSIWVRGMDAKARLDDGWTFEPSTKPQKAVKPHWRQRRRMKISKAEANVIKPANLDGPEDLNIEEINNGD